MPTYTSQVQLDNTTKGVATSFDYKTNGTRTFQGWDRPGVPENFRIGLIVGPSGSGKSLLLKEFGEEKTPLWEKGKSIASHFNHPDEAQNRLMSVGLSSIPAWCSDYHILSTGEKFRADLARKLENNAVIDEFTSVVDRNVAKAACCAVRRFVDKENLFGIVMASCHEDIIPWLQPDWYFTTTDGIFHDGRLLRRPKIAIRLYPCKRSVWRLFKTHHYLSGDLSSACKSWLATADFGHGEVVVGFVASLPFPSGTLENAWRAHRTVVLPDFQGLGIGPAISDGVAEIMVNGGNRRYFSRTAHPRFGQYRNTHPPTDKKGGWIKTAEDGKIRSRSRIRANGKQDDNGMGDQRECSSHEFVPPIVRGKIRPKIKLNF